MWITLKKAVEAWYRSILGGILGSLHKSDIFVRFARTSGEYSHHPGDLVSAVASGKLSTASIFLAAP